MQRSTLGTIWHASELPDLTPSERRWLNWGFVGLGLEVTLLIVLGGLKRPWGLDGGSFGVFVGIGVMLLCAYAAFLRSQRKARVVIVSLAIGALFAVLAIVVTRLR
jgi:hypothetical protein